MAGTPLSPQLVYGGIPHSDTKQPDPKEIIVLLDSMVNGISGVQTGYLGKQTKALLDADLAYAAGTLARVWGDATAANNTAYVKLGASGAGSWEVRPELGNRYIVLTNAGAGTANALVVTSTEALPSGAYAGKFLTHAVLANTGAVTVAVNGAAARPLVTASGTALVADYFSAGMGLEFIDDGTSYRLTSDITSAAIQAAAEAALADLLQRYLGPYADDTAATTAAGTPFVGQLYWNTTDDILKSWNGTGWVGAGAGASVITHGEDVGNGVDTDFTLPANAETTNTHLYIDGRRITSGFTLAAGALALSEALGDLVSISWDVFDVSPVGATTATLVSVGDAGGYFTGATVEEVLQEIGDTLTIITAPVTPEQFSGTATQKVQAALDAGNPEVRIDETYSCGTLTIPSGVRLLHGRGELVQLASGSNLLTANGVDNLTVSVDLTGLGTSNISPVSSNDLIYFVGCDDLLIEHCKISRSLFRPIWVDNGDRVRINNVHFFENCIGGARLYRLRKFWVTDCHIDGTCIDPAQFTTGFGCESDDGLTASGWCRDGLFRGNTIEDLGWSQGVLIHSGINIKLIENTVKGSTIGLSVNPATATDVCTYPILMSNHIECLTAAGAWGVQAGVGINVQAGGITTNISGPQVVANTIINANRESGNTNEGGIAWSYVNGGGMHRNEIVSARGNAVVINASYRLSCNDNTFYNVEVGAAAQQNGVLALGTSTGMIHDNTGFGAGTLVDITASASMDSAGNFAA